MIHPYEEYKLDVYMPKVAEMFELAVYYENLDIDTFAFWFASSFIAKAIEKGDFIYGYGKSSNELLALLLNIEPKSYDDQPEHPSVEYWVGLVLTYNQWYLNQSFEELLRAVSASKLMLSYNPYHEMDITKTSEIFLHVLEKRKTLQKLRLKKNYSQRDLSIASGVPLRNIKAYERGQIEISKASGETLYLLAKALDCSIEDLLV